nr:restriction endonuclease [uncultured Campylobacter sp.]
MIITIQIAGSIIVIITIIALAYKKKENKKYNDFIDKFEKNNKKENKEIHIEKEKNQKLQNDEKLLDCYEKVYKTNYKTANQIKKELGDKYEIQIGEYFKSLNFKIYYNGINNGKKDGGIDIIAWSSNQVLLIQCKNHKEQIKQDFIRKFIGDCAIYENKYKDKIKNREVKRIFASNSTADYGATKFINENKNIIDFIRIKADCRDKTPTI